MHPLLSKVRNSGNKTKWLMRLGAEVKEDKNIPLTMDELTLFSKDFSMRVVISFLLVAPLTLWIMNQCLQQYTYSVEVEWWMVTSTGGLPLPLMVIFRMV